MKSKNIFLQISLSIIWMFTAIEGYTQDTTSYMDAIILMNGGQLKSEYNGKNPKAILPEGARLNETTLPDGNKLQELILSDGNKIQVYLNPNGMFIKQVDTSPGGTIVTHTMEGDIEHITIQNPDGTKSYVTATMQLKNKMNKQ